jgi:hypothetical protein
MVDQTRVAKDAATTRLCQNLLHNLCDACRLYAIKHAAAALYEAAERHEERAESEWSQDPQIYAKLVCANLHELVTFLDGTRMFSQPGDMPALDLASDFLKGRLTLLPGTAGRMPMAIARVF